MAQNTTPSSTVSSATPTDPRIAAMSAILAQNWWAVAIRGVCGIVFGLIALFLPGATILTLVLFFSAYMLVDGIFGVVAAVRAVSHHQRWGLLVLEGVLNIAVGVIAFIWPGLTAVTFVLLIAAWAIVTGVLEIVAALRLHPEYGRWWLILSGVGIGHLRRAAGCRAACRCHCGDVVDRCFRSDLRDHAPRSGLPSARTQGQWCAGGRLDSGRGLIRGRLNGVRLGSPVAEAGINQRSVGRACTRTSGDLQS